MDRAADFSLYLPDLDLFSRLPPNTDVHLSKDGHFSYNGGTYSSILGAQSVASLYSGYSSERLAKEIGDFAGNIIAALQDVFNEGQYTTNSKFQMKAFCIIKSANTSISNALKGAVKNGGMRGLLLQHTKEPFHTAMEVEMDYMQSAAARMLRSSLAWPAVKEKKISENNQESFCPEEFFEDDDWEKAIDASSFFRPESTGFFKYYGNYSTALVYSQAQASIQGIDWFNTVAALDNYARLYLGALPMIVGSLGYEWRNDLETIKAEGIEAVLSVLEVFENTSTGYIGSPVTPMQWREAGIKHLQLPAIDFDTPPLELIQRGVAFIEWNNKKGRSTYVHCKAAKGRSALVVMCYLVKHLSFSADEAFNLVENACKQAGFKKTSKKMQALLAFEKLCSAFPKELL